MERKLNFNVVVCVTKRLPRCGELARSLGFANPILAGTSDRPTSCLLKDSNYTLALTALPDKFGEIRMYQVVLRANGEVTNSPIVLRIANAVVKQFAPNEPLVHDYEMRSAYYAAIDSPSTNEIPCGNDPLESNASAVFQSVVLCEGAIRNHNLEGVKERKSGLRELAGGEKENRLCCQCDNSDGIVVTLTVEDIPGSRPPMKRYDRTFAGGVRCDGAVRAMPESLMALAKRPDKTEAVARDVKSLSEAFWKRLTGQRMQAELDCLPCR